MLTEEIPPTPPEEVVDDHLGFDPADLTRANTFSVTGKMVIEVPFTAGDVIDRTCGRRLMRPSGLG